ncbi:MAG: cupin domain-containing protein [Deltaproteobacteria bacterium]|nr:cupin domain-containing protein [Deltaproteobacteria bacterium]
MEEKPLKFLHVNQEDKEWEKTYGEKAAYSEKKLLTAADTPIASVVRRIVTTSGDLQADGYVAHSHPGAEILYVIRGKLDGWIDGIGEVEIKEGDLLFLDAGIEHAGNICSEEFEAISIRIPAD